MEVDLPGDPEKRLMLYWRNSLADESRLGVSQQLAEGLPVSWGEVVQGTFGPSFMAQARKQWNVGELDPIGPIVICPVHLQPRVSHGFARQAADATPFWIPGFLDKDGAVNPTSFGAWVCRENLAPSDGEALLVGTLEAQDQYLSRTPLPMDGGEGGWQKCMDWALGLFHAVIGGNPRDVAFDGYDKRVLNGSAIPACIVIRIDSSMRMVAPLVGAYDWFVKQPEIPLLMKQAASLAPRIEAVGPVTLSKEDQLQWSRAHLGQLKGSFPLSESQRESLIHHLSLGGRGILAVNGPPGTGKTTLLHSMIANRVVEAALQKGEAPVIVASSTNNTAVKNVIESLSNPKETNPLAQRWLPGIVHFGCYMPSRDKLEKATKDGYQAFNSGDQGFMADKCSGAYLGEAERYFLERFRQAGLGEVSSAEEASDALHLRLSEVVGKLTRLYESWDEYKQALVRYSSLVGGRTGVAAQFNAASHAVSRGEALLRAWLVVDQARSWWSRAFHFVPFVKAQEMSRRQAFLALQGLECPNRPALEDLNGWVIRHLDDCRDQAKRLEEQLSMIRGDIASARNTVHQYQEVRKSLGLPRDLWKAQGRLDTTLRVQAFNLAARYWEARWLMEIREKVDVGGGWNIRKPADKKAFFRHVAKVAPCMVVTLHRLPSEFSFGGPSNKSYFSEFIDLLVLDESGQVAPQVGSVSFAFAKCAVVVGDIKQIAPVRKMQGAVDEANIRRHGLLEAGPPAPSFLRQETLQSLL